MRPADWCVSWPTDHTVGGAVVKGFFSKGFGTFTPAPNPSFSCFLASSCSDVRRRLRQPPRCPQPRCFRSPRAQRARITAPILPTTTPLQRHLQWVLFLTSSTVVVCTDGMPMCPIFESRMIFWRAPASCEFTTLKRAMRCVSLNDTNHKVELIHCAPFSAERSTHRISQSGQHHRLVRARTSPRPGTSLGTGLEATFDTLHRQYTPRFSSLQAPCDLAPASLRWTHGYEDLETTTISLLPRRCKLAPR
jgi:hypothetical protein